MTARREGSLAVKGKRRDGLTAVGPSRKMVNALDAVPSVKGTELVVLRKSMDDERATSAFPDSAITITGLAFVNVFMN